MSNTLPHINKFYDFCAENGIDEDVMYSIAGWLGTEIYIPSSLPPKPQAKTISEILDRYFLANQKGQFEDDQGNICWYLDDLAKNIPIATQAITQAMLDALPEWHKVDPIRDIDYRYCMGWNECRDQMESAIKKIGGSDG